jgi:putative endonuclease
MAGLDPAISRNVAQRYRLKRLVWAERHATILSAIQREKNIKHWPRKWKVDLIEAANPEWRAIFTINSCDRDGRVKPRP